MNESDKSVLDDATSPEDDEAGRCDSRSDAPDTEVDARFQGSRLRLGTSPTMMARDPSVSVTVPAPPPAKEPSTGDTVGGKYQLRGLLGSGGMGKVYQAVHIELDARFAIKLMHSFVVGLPEHSQRFRREARAASRISHPNVVRVVDFGIDGESHYLVMEFVDGINLGDWLDGQSEPPALEILVPILLQTLDALTAAHEAGVVHRDLKPDNVILAENQRGGAIVKVTDFGLARFEDSADAGVTFTKDDAVAGTPGYMSPEQCRSLKVGPSADLYAFGCILTEVLQLEPPFVAETAMDVISQQLFMPPGRLVRPDGAEPIPELLEKLRLELLAKSPHQRPASAREVRERLLEAMDPAAAALRQPARKGEIPVGGRGDRIPRWNREGPTKEKHTDEPEGTIALVRVVSDQPSVAGSVVTGLAAQQLRVVPAPSVEGADSAVVLVDGGADVQATAEVLRKLTSLHPEVTLVVCTADPSQATLNLLIELGAREVVRLPTTSDVLARRLRRALKHARRRRGVAEQ